MQLYNKLSSKERATLIDQSNKERITLSFYQYAKILDPKPQGYVYCELLGLDPIYVANEGIFICIIDGQGNKPVFHINKINLFF